MFEEMKSALLLLEEVEAMRLGLRMDGFGVGLWWFLL